jgi:hypothetical protein
MKEKKPLQEWTSDECDRAVAFFALLLKVDRRVNPHLYKNKKAFPSSKKIDSQSYL